MMANMTPALQQDQYHTPPSLESKGLTPEKSHPGSVGRPVVGSCCDALGHGTRRAGDNLGMWDLSACQGLV